MNVSFSSFLGEVAVLGKAFKRNNRFGGTVQLACRHSYT
ncbi:hypothetical protein CES85_3557 (plasmid) [Ochrobactrum quorumnocens]|uniref:Uncharacterized protein n=1 Tax=Ochrobactrum quorumnocens TaxID=271865 RepID=A0A248UN36_9HYPH|nr:hypothetical protein CES85_3557 [[Ochrobactrum] quorumnocens]